LCLPHIELDSAFGQVCAADAAIDVQVQVAGR
jgi:hypothetical protein